MKRSLWLTATAILAIAGGLVGVGAANASNVPANAVDGQLVSPAKTANGTTYYTDSQIDEVWAAVTAHYPQRLPDGVTFPTAAPAFFHPTTEGPHYFEVGLPDMIAAQYWRCAWLEDSVRPSTRASSAATAADSATLDKFGNLPSVKSHLNLSAYESMIAGYAKASGKDSRDAEISLQCSGFDIQGGAK